MRLPTISRASIGFLFDACVHLGALILAGPLLVSGLQLIPNAPRGVLLLPMIAFASAIPTIRMKVGNAAWACEYPILAGALTLAAPRIAIAGWMIGVCAHALFWRSAGGMRIRIWNCAMYAWCAAAAAVVASKATTVAVLGLSDAPEAAQCTVFFAAGVTAVVVDAGLTTISNALDADEAAIPQLRAAFSPVAVTHHIALLSIGFVGVMLLEKVPWAVPLVVPPAIAITVASSAYMSANDERKRIRALYHGAADLHGVRTVEDALDVLLVHARAGVGGSVEIRDRAGAPDELTLPLDEGETSHRFLVISDLGRSVDDDDRQVLNALGTLCRETLERIRLADEAQRMACEDALTGLVNRREFQRQLDGAVGRGENVGLLFVDLDGFKEVNDTLGHAAGDELLRGVAARLRRAIRTEDTAGRAGGDEFCVLVRRPRAPEDVHEAAARVAAALREPMMLDGREIAISGSVGVAMTNSRNDTVEALIRRADQKMYAAKRARQASGREPGAAA